MKKQKLVTHLFTSYIFIAIVAILLIIFFSSRAIEKFYFEQKIHNLEARAELLKEVIIRSGDSDTESFQKLCLRIGLATRTRVTIIDTLGLVLADSEEKPANMDNHGDRPEVIEALASGEGLSQRHSYTLEQEHLYYAKLIGSGEEKLIIRLSFSTLALEEILGSLKVDLILIGIGVIILIGALNWYISRLITKPIQIMEVGAKRFARGKLKLRVPESDIHELGSLARSLNEMAEQIFDRIRTVTQQKNEQIAILSSMTEGVIALDPKGVVLSINRAAAEMFGLKPKNILNRPLYEIIRHAELNNFVSRVYESKKNQQCRVQIYEPEDRILNVIGSRMPAKKGAIAGAVIVLTDLTQIQKLEGVRRDFVANVSHELKTPITSIQGYVETLQEGALYDKENAERFLSIIAKHADRLGQIVDDLLELSRIEEISEGDDQYFELTSVNELFEGAIQDFQVLTTQRHIEILKDLEPETQLNVNKKLMNHALGNLLDNALKYSDEGGQVTLRCFSKKKKIIIEVIDNGLGIELEHLGRIFERFYRVDKGRTRDVGGTGLGLSIVRHIARIHNSELEVDSYPGKGSTFRMIFRNT